MTGEDHATDALVAALQSPALPAEQVGEAKAVAAMLEARTIVPAGSRGLRSRRGVAIAAVTVASLGIGGLAAAGPGIFSPAADRPVVTPPAPRTMSDPSVRSEDETPDDGEPTPARNDETSGVARITEDPDVECADGNHGRTVSSIATATSNDPAAVSVAAQSDCGKPDHGETDEPAVDDGCADPNHGETVSSVARSTDSGPGKGAVVSETARTACDPTETDAPGKSGDAPGKSGDAPGKSGESVETPAPASDRPAPPVEPPARPDNAPAKPDNASGKP